MLGTVRRHFIIILILLVITPLEAWGPTGHRTIGNVAESYLSRKAKKNVERVLGHKTLAEVSVWMDDIRSDDSYDHTHDWHWVTVPTGMTYEQTDKNPNGDIISAIKRMMEEIKSGNLDAKTEREHLQMIVHLVGDFHMPLHVGNGEDQGGNKVEVKWFGQRSNLHRVWDSDIIESMQYSYTELAQSLRSPSSAEVKKWQADDFDIWVKEAQDLHPFVYDLPESGSLGYPYRYVNWSRVEEQLLKGGVRLAGIINQIYQ